MYPDNLRLKIVCFFDNGAVFFFDNGAVQDLGGVVSGIPVRETPVADTPLSFSSKTAQSFCLSFQTD